MRQHRMVAIALALACVLAFVPGGAAEPDPYAGYVNEHAYVPTQYGSIYVQYWRPVEGRVPVLLSMSPYRYLYGWPDPTGSVDPMKDVYAERFLPRGYARAYADLLGTGFSDGCWDYGGLSEAAAGAAVVEWLGTRPWSTGKVGMIGTSYDGAIQLETATLAPRHLKAIVPLEPVSSWYHYNYESAVSHNSTDDDVGVADTGYPVGTPDLFDFVLARTPNTDPTLSPDARAANLADRASECEAIEHNYRGHIVDPSYGAFWRERDWSLRASKVRAAILLQHGWRDSNTKPDQFWRFWTALPRSVDKRALLGRWNHTDVFDTPPDYATPPVDTAAYLAAFLDVHLKGRSAKLLARYPRVLTQSSDGVWRTSLPVTARPATVSWSRAGTFVNTGGETSKVFKDARSPSMPTMGIWSTAPFRRTSRIVGPSFVDATVSIDSVRGQLNAALLDVGPDGETSVVAIGLQDLRYAHDPAAPRSLRPGEVMKVSVRLRPVDAIVPAGHHLELVLTGSNVVWGIPDPVVGQLYEISHLRLRLPLASTGSRVTR